ncbi:hypothetical protein CA13_04990 [Planctomycetes bacterium CA13]|uniref:Chemotaxis phosphatase CheX-like domain-containing protein n=1 Tax=Novipirellula herctigrandis TaxID=2527986 RepID=A0A5C5YVM3_9BACT|nr:hypothetical protein CA13_04990 [Planctomycetes bacterium CA13]
MALCIDTETAVMEAANGSLGEVFEMMVGESLTPFGTCDSQNPLSESNKGNADDDVSVVVAISGDLNGSVNICLDKDSAFRWARQLIDHETDTMDQTVVDAVGELGNMVVGGTKRRLASYNLTMSLPSVVRAGVECLEFPSHIKPARLDYQYDEHRLAIVVALSKQG